MPPKANADQADSLGDNELTRLANRFGADKGSSPGRHHHPHLYTPIYQRFLAPHRERPIRLLEIGVFKGASLRMWEIYLPNAQIVGVDINPRRAEHASHRAAVAIGDATDPEFLRNVLDTYFGGTVDVVIDDGSHILEEMIVTLETLFPHLSDDGLYFIEDICASRFEGFRRGEKPFSDFLDYLSSVAEQLTFFADFRSDIYHSIRDIRELSKAGVEPPPRSLWNERLTAVHLFHNLCVLTKGPRDFPYDPSRTAEGQGSDPYIPAREGQGFRLATIEAEVDRLRSELSATKDALAKWAAEAGRLSTELSAAVETLTDQEAEAA